MNHLARLVNHLARLVDYLPHLVYDLPRLIDLLYDLDGLLLSPDDHLPWSLRRLNTQLVRDLSALSNSHLLLEL